MLQKTNSNDIVSATKTIHVVHVNNETASTSSVYMIPINAEQQNTGIVLFKLSHYMKTYHFIRTHSSS